MNANQTVLNDFITKHPLAAAQAIEPLPSEEVAHFFQTLSLEKSLKLLSFMNKKKAADCLVLFPSSRAKELIEKGDPVFIASLLKYTDAPKREALLADLSSGRRNSIKQQLSFSPDTVAALLEPAVVVTRKTTIPAAIELIKRNTTTEEFYLYVVDTDHVFKGIVRFKELFLAEQTAFLHELMLTTVPSFLPDIAASSILEHPAWLDYQELPILDTSDRLLGKLSHRNVLKFTTTSDKVPNSEITETGNALGELYRIGLAGLFQSSER